MKKKTRFFRALALSVLLAISSSPLVVLAEETTVAETTTVETTIADSTETEVTSTQVPSTAGE